jgi:uncharacterized Fe-S cluster protein YjdI
MPKYVIEREIPGAGDLSQEQLTAISQKSCGVLKKMGPEIQWVESYVTQDKIYCIYIAPNEETVRRHAAEGGFPANRISVVKHKIDPATAEGPNVTSPGIDWDAEKCCHAGVCVSSLPAVFKVVDGEFRIDPSAAAPDKIREVVAKCPSGALSMTS